MSYLYQITIAALVMSAGGCVSAPSLTGADKPAQQSQPAEAGAAAGAETTAPDDAAQDAATQPAASADEIAETPAPAETQAAQDEPGQSSGLSAVELRIWNDPVFQKQFTESYIANTEIEPRVTVNERDAMMKVMELISEEKVDEAAALLEKGRGPAASAVFDFTLANIHFQRDELETAAELYQAAVEKYPKFRRAWKNLGLIYIRTEKFEKALPALTKVLELGGADSTTYGLLGFAYSSVDNNLAAESAYRMAVLLSPKTMDWKMGLARSLFKQERFADAVALTKHLIAENPGRADFWLLQANALIGLNQPLRAAENYEIVDRMGASTVESLNMLGDIYVNEELYGLAVDAYIRAMDQNPEKNKPQRAVRAAKVLVARGAMGDTRRLIEKLETVYGDSFSDDDRKDLLKLRARIAVAEGAGDEEVRVLEKIVELDPLDGEALILLGQHASRAENYDKAAFYYERAAAIEKYEADAKVRHAQLLVTQSRYGEALPLLRSAQQLKPRENVQKYLEQVERIAKAR